ncbi:hypothetical protein ACN47E_006400 [Coniothyrium glycines]
MTFRELTLRLKRSVPGLFPSSRHDQTDTAVRKLEVHPHHEDENSTPDLKDLGASVHDIHYSCPNFSTSSRIAGSLSRRNKLLGGLRDGSLRKVESLRNLRSSSSRMKDSDEPLVTPVSPTNSPLALDFGNLPSDRSMIEIPSRTSTSSSLKVLHSSPIAMPCSSVTGNFRSKLADPAMLPVGTLPTTPAPLVVALEHDSFFEDISDSPESKAESRATDPLPTPMPGTTFAFDDIPAPAVSRTSGDAHDPVADWADVSDALESLSEADGDTDAAVLESDSGTNVLNADLNVVDREPRDPPGRPDVTRTRISSNSSDSTVSIAESFAERFDKKWDTLSSEHRPNLFPDEVLARTREHTTVAPYMEEAMSTTTWIKKTPLQKNETVGKKKEKDALEKRSRHNDADLYHKDEALDPYRVVCTRTTECTQPVSSGPSSKSPQQGAYRQDQDEGSLESLASILGAYACLGDSEASWETASADVGSSRRSDTSR